MPWPAILNPPLILASAAVVLLLIGRFAGRERWWGVLSLLALGAAGGALWNAAGAEAIGPPPTTRAVFVQDGAALGLQAGCVVFGALFVLTALMRPPGRLATGPTAAEMCGLLLMSLTGAMLAGAANDLLVLFLALELTGLPLFFLLALPEDRPLRRRSESIQKGGQAPCMVRQRRTQNTISGSQSPFSDRLLVLPRPAVRFGLLWLLSSLILLYGFAWMYGLGGTTNLTDLRGVLTASYAPPAPREPVGSGSRLGVTALVLIFAGLGFRLGAIPFQFGLPGTFHKMNAWQTGLLAVIPRAAALVVLVRVGVGTMAGFEERGQLLALVVAGATLIVGGLTMLIQSNVRRLIAGLTTTQAGLALVGVAAGFWEAAHPRAATTAALGLPGGTTAALFQLGADLLAVTGLAAVLVYLRRREGEMEYVDELRGLVRFEPLAAGSAALCLLSLAGLPPLPGFWGRLWVLGAAVSVHAEPAGIAVPVPHPAFLIVSLAALVGILATAAVALRLLTLMFLDSGAARPQPTGGRPALAAACLAAVLLVVLGLFPGLLVRVLML